MPWRWRERSRSALDFSEIYVYGPMVAAPAAVLLVAGAARGNRTLELAPLRFVGRVSYAWYLWHVPLLRLTGTTYAGIAAVPPLVVAFVIAVGSTFLLEEPLRRAWRARQEQTRVQVPAAFEPRGSQPRPSTP